MIEGCGYQVIERTLQEKNLLSESVAIDKGDEKGEWLGEGRWEEPL